MARYVYDCSECEARYEEAWRAMECCEEYSGFECPLCKALYPEESEADACCPRDAPLVVVEIDHG